MNANDYFKSGLAKLNKQDYDGAIADFSKAIELKPDDADAYNNRGLSKYNKQDYDSAIIDFTKAIELNPKYAKAYNNRGKVKLDKKDYDSAIIDFTKTIELNSYYAEAYNNRGKVKLDKKDCDSAIIDFTKAIELNPDDAVAYNNRGNAKADKKDYDSAIIDFTKAIELNPDYEDAYNNRGVIKAEKRYFNDAIIDFTKAIELNPKDGYTYSNRALAKTGIMDYDNAIIDHNQAINLDPENAQFYYHCGVTEYARKDYDSAIKNVEKALKIDPNLEKPQNLKITAEAKKSQAEFTSSKQQYDKLAQEMRDLKTNFEKNQKQAQKDVEQLKLNNQDVAEKVEGFLSEVTAQSLSKIYAKQSNWQFWFFIGLRGLEAVIYIAIACFLYTKGFPWLEAMLNDKEITIYKIISILLIKIGIVIPIYLLIRLINTTAKRFSQRSELDGDTVTQWLFYDKMEIELKNLKDDVTYGELYKNFMEQNIILRQKTNFERIEEIFAKRYDKSLSLKQIDALADTAKKIKDVCVTTKEEEKDK